jgi:hypothetical protein
VGECRRNVKEDAMAKPAARRFALEQLTPQAIGTRYLTVYQALTRPA